MRFGTRGRGRGTRTILGMVVLTAALAACGAYGSSAPASSPPVVHASPRSGATLFFHVCFYCHGSHGQGNAHHSGAPALWGSTSPLVTGGALNGALNTLPGLAAYIKANMPLRTVNGVSPGSLSREEAYAVARFIRSHDHARRG